MIKIVTFSCSFTYAGKYRISAMLCCNITDKFLNKNRLTYTGTAEKTDLTTLLIRTEKIDNLDSRFKNLG